MTSFDWDMSADVYEDMVSCLLSNLNPKTLRIDGTGGDGGRDVQYETPEGLHIYELKSFTRRMTAGRRAQVQLSLAKAATNNPAGWELVVPTLDPTEPRALHPLHQARSNYRPVHSVSCFCLALRGVIEWRPHQEAPAFSGRAVCRDPWGSSTLSVRVIVRHVIVP